MQSYDGHVRFEFSRADWDDRKHLKEELLGTAHKDLDLQPWSEEHDPTKQFFAVEFLIGQRPGVDRKRLLDHLSTISQGLSGRTGPALSRMTGKIGIEEFKFDAQS